MTATVDDAVADLRRANAELRRQLDERTAERDEGEAQKAAMAEVLEVINSSPGDLAPVFDAMLEKAHTLCEAARGSLTIYNGEHFRAVATHGMPEAFAEVLRQPRSPTWTEEQLLHGERFVHIPDMRALPSAPDDQIARASLEFTGTRTLLFVPLRKDDVLLGFITAYREEVRPFTDKQIALLQNFAAQAVIAMENARLITETREALDQQTATAEVLGVINSSPGDLAPVFDAMLEKAMRLGEAVFGMMHTYDGEQFHTAAMRGVPEAYTEYRERNPPVISPGTGPARILEGERVVHIVDLEAEEAYRSPQSVNRALVDLAGARSILTAALHREDALLGMLTIYRQEVRAFTDKQIVLLQNFAAQAVIAMENARLISETRDALEQQTATAEVLQVINSSPGDLAPVFDAMLEKALRLCNAAFGGMVTRDEGAVQFRVQRNIPPDFLEFVQRELTEFRPDTLIGRAMLSRSVVHVADIQAGEPYRRGDPLAIAASELAGIRTMLFVPLVRDDTAIGVFTIYRTEVQPFTEKQITLLQNFAAQAVIAIENARLLGELRQRTEEVAELNRGLEARVEAQVDELGRVGRLKRFLAPQLAELIVSQGDEKILESHRREIVVVFCDLRGYTAFAETAEPEEVLDFLREYHGALGPLVAEYEGTLDQFSGDGIMVFFNDPVPIPDPAERAVKMAVAMREVAGTLIVAWRERGRELGFGAGIAQGYATLGQIGFAERSGYTAIGTVCNVAARLCAEAKDGQILLSQRVNVALKGSPATEQIGALTLKGLAQPVVAYNVPLVAGQAALRVIEGGAPST